MLLAMSPKTYSIRLRMPSSNRLLALCFAVNAMSGCRRERKNHLPIIPTRKEDNTFVVKGEVFCRTIRSGGGVNSNLPIGLGGIGKWGWRLLDLNFPIFSSEFKAGSTASVDLYSVVSRAFYDC